MIYAKVPKSKVKRKPGWKQDEVDYQEHLKKIGITPSHTKQTKESFQRN